MLPPGINPNVLRREPIAPSPTPATVTVDTYRQVVAMPCSGCRKPIAALDTIVCYKVEGGTIYRCVACAFARAHAAAILLLKESP